jgi:hypothetical protein
MKHIDTIIDILAPLALALIIIFLLFIGWCMMVKTTNTEHNKSAYIPCYTEAEYDRLSKKHGNPGVIIEEPGKVPYYYNKEGKKCKLI